MEDELRNQAVYGALLDSALDGLGIYFASVTGGTNDYEKRTEYMEGWNAAQKQVRNAVVKYYEFVKELEPEQKRAVQDLLLADRLHLYLEEDGRVLMLAGLNDVFGSCADDEEVRPDEVIALRDVWAAFGYDGVVAWAADKQGVEPTNYLKHKNNRVSEARKWIKEKV
jgi:hypothetical protein